MPFHPTTIFTLAHLLSLSLAHLPPQQKTPFKLAILHNNTITDAHPSFLLQEAILFSIWICKANGPEHHKLWANEISRYLSLRLDLKGYRSELTLDKVMVCCLMTPSHYPNQSWLIIKCVSWNLSHSLCICTCTYVHEFWDHIFRIIVTSPRDQWDNIAVFPALWGGFMAAMAWPNMVQSINIVLCFVVVMRTLHDCLSQMNENLLISNSKLTSDSELIWWR